MGPVELSIAEDLGRAFPGATIEVLNESGQHRHQGGGESHFRVGVVWETFAGRPLVARHRDVHRALAAQLAGGLHALSVEACTPEEWTARGASLTSSPKCLGGSHGDAST